MRFLVIVFILLLILFLLIKPIVYAIFCVNIQLISCNIPFKLPFSHRKCVILHPAICRYRQ